ncbi:MAG: DUF4880 domain-containing protein, partial [Pseudomonadota bacterium]
MNINEKIREDAVAWAISLQEAPEDTKTLSAFLTWLDASEEHRAAWAHLERTRAVAIEASSETDELPPADADKQQWSSDQNSLPTDPSASSAMSSRSMAMTSAGAFAILLTVYAAWPSIMETLRADHVAGTGEMK